MGSAIADTLAVVPEFQAWYNVLKATAQGIDLSKLLVYDIDNVDASALPYLAAQFDVLGYGGMKLATTPDQQRALIKNAIFLHRYKGTEWAIIQALGSIGFSDIILKKGIAGGYDHWAKFGIEITNSSVALTEENYNDIIGMVNTYKRAVCVLEDVSMSFLFTDTLTNTDWASATQAIYANDNLYLSKPATYDGAENFNGDETFSGDTDSATIT